jgi:antitoxin PrlF
MNIHNILNNVIVQILPDSDPRGGSAMHAKRVHRDRGCCGAAGKGRTGVMTGLDCCKIEAVISVDERGQVVLPKDVREKAGIRAGDKLAVIMHGSHGSTCCINLIKADGLVDSVKTMLGPMMKEIFG